MEHHPLSPSESCEDSPPPIVGELVVENGRLRGTRRALNAALTLIGRDPACEIHLNLDGIHPLHCAIVHALDGYWLRDLGGTSGTLVNGVAIGQRRLLHDDVIAIGPFQFRLDLPVTEEPPEPPLTVAALQAEREALRIQTAAVAAQQAGLSAEEMQLQQRRKALVRQKEQLAGHLEERRRELMELREQVRQERLAAKAESEAAEERNEQLKAALCQEREAVQQELRQAAREWRRAIELRKRLKKRWRRHWRKQESDLQQRERKLTDDRTKLERESADLRREMVQLTQAQLRFNGEVELGRRRLQDEWQQLGLAQQQWEACLNQEQKERAIRLSELDRRAAVLVQTERNLREQRQQIDQLQCKLRKETEGLEARIRNQRRKLLEQEKQLAQTQILAAREEPVPVVVVRPREDAPASLLRLAGDLADQRRHLLEQWRHFLELHEAWAPERAEVLIEIEVTAGELVRREQQLLLKEQALCESEAELRRRQESLFEVRCSLEAWQARLTARETFLDNQRVMLLADVRAREEQAEARAYRLEEMRQRRMRRRRQEIEELRRARQQHEQMRRDYALLWQECQERRAQLIREQRDFSVKSLALEQFRQELLGRTADTPEADKRLERLYRRHLSHIEAEERDLSRDRAALVGDTKRLDERAGRLSEQEQALTADHEKWMRQVAEWEEQQAAAAAQERQRQQELRHWQLMHEQDECQLAALREEVERMARLLLDETELTVPPSNRAA